MNFKFPNKITNKEFWNIYAKSFLFLEISFLIPQILFWIKPVNNYGKIKKLFDLNPFTLGI